MGSESPYKEKVYQLLDNDPLIDEKTALIAVGCVVSTWYAWKKKYFTDELPERKKAQDRLLKRKTKKHKNNKKVKYEVVAIIPKDKWQDFCEFVGYKGYKDTTGKIILDHTFIIIEETISNPVYIEATEEMPMEFIPEQSRSPTVIIKKKQFTYPYYPGEAIPEPIDDDTQEEVGILWYQLEGFIIIESNDNILILWPRGHGKTWLLAWYIEWNMKHSKYKAMYLSITDVVNDVADWVFDWADINNHVPTANKSKGSQSQRRQTPTSFTLKNGSKFKIFSVMDKKVRGKHGYTIFMDDIIEEGSQTRPSKQRDLERKWNATHSKMRRNKLVIVNTRIYEDDFIEYLMKQFTNKHKIMLKRKPQDAGKWLLTINLLTPFIEAKDGEVEDKDGFLLTSEGRRVLIAPELYTLEYFEAESIADFESYMAEYMQKPTSMEGGMVDENDIKYVDRPFWKEVQAICIAVDSTESDLDSTDMCGIVSCAMLKSSEKKNYPEFVFLDADVRKMPFRTLKKTDPNGKITIHQGIMETISFFMEQYEAQYINVIFYIAIETQGGGKFIIKEALNNKDKWPWFRYMTGDRKKEKRPEDLGLKDYGIRHTQQKVARVFSELRYPIKQAYVKFAKNLFGSVFIRQLLTYPKGKFDDGPDAGGMAKDELAKRWHYYGQIVEPYAGVMAAFKSYNEGKYKNKTKDFVFQPQGSKELEGIKNKIKRKMRGIFG